MMAKKIPLRQCVGCRERKGKKDLLRIIRTPEGEIAFDPVGKRNGRGAYICPSLECLKKAVRSGALSRALKHEIPEEIIHHLEEELTELDTER